MFMLHAQYMQCRNTAFLTGSGRIEPNSLNGCFVAIGLIRQDCPEGYQRLVQPLKTGDTHGLCLSCYYVKRGSFKKMTQNEFVRVKRKVKACGRKWRVCARVNIFIASCWPLQK